MQLYWQKLKISPIWLIFGKFYCLVNSWTALFVSLELVELIFGVMAVIKYLFPEKFSHWKISAIKNLCTLAGGGGWAGGEKSK
jgi:hypothetical protein